MTPAKKAAPKKGAWKPVSKEQHNRFYATIEVPMFGKPEQTRADLESTLKRELPLFLSAATKLRSIRKAPISKLFDQDAEQ